MFYDLLEKLEENIISMFEKKQRKEDFIGNLFTILKKIKMKTVRYGLKESKSKLVFCSPSSLSNRLASKLLILTI